MNCLLDAELNYVADVDECIDMLLNLTSPFTVNVFRNKDFLEIVVTFNGTFDIFETISSGREMCKITKGSTEKPSNKWKLLADIHPECVR